RLGDARDGAHQRLARIGERLLLLPHRVRFFLSIALELIRDVAKTIALRARAFELLRLFIESGLLLSAFLCQRVDLSARALDALHEIAEVRFGLLQERAKALDFTRQSGDLLAHFRRAMRAIGVNRARF